MHTDSISVQLQPIGSHQNIIVKRWDDDFIYLQGQGLPIDCFYHVYGERKDVNSVLVEYEGNSRIGMIIQILTGMKIQKCLPKSVIFVIQITNTPRKYDHRLTKLVFFATICKK